MNKDEKLALYVLDVYTSDTRNKPTYSHRHLNECDDTEVHNLEVVEHVTEVGASFTYVSAFLRCGHHWNIQFDHRLHGTLEGLRAAADITIVDAPRGLTAD